MIYTMLIPPVITGIACYLMKSKKRVELANILGTCVEIAIVLLFTLPAMFDPVYEFADGIWYLDTLSAYFIILIAIIGALSCFYSIGYMDHEFMKKEVNLQKLRSYYLIVHIFIATMIFVCVTQNLAVMWIAIESTTIVSAFLVGFYNNKKSSVEAAWKYMIICSAGITLALFGTIIMNLNSTTHLNLSDPFSALNWTVLRDQASSLNVGLLKLTFILVFVGYATKAGLVPMHTWLPDAHSQAPTPVSAMLSGVLLNCAVYGILRFHTIVVAAGVKVGEIGFSSLIMLLFGFLSIIVATPFIIIAKDYKRLLAYSSIENMGIIMSGFGIGAAFGALFHIMNHSLTKPLLFFGAGIVQQKYETREMERVRSMGRIMPVTAIVFLLGILALVGTPPFSIFMSEVMILNVLILQSNYILAIVLIGMIVLVFAGFTAHAGPIIFSFYPTEPTMIIEQKLPVAQVEHAEVHEAEATIDRVPKGEMNYVNLFIMSILLLLIFVIGLTMPAWLMIIIKQMAVPFTT
jgi:hydrogenase-4 component F